MNKNSFEKIGAFENNPKWAMLINRQKKMYFRENDIRSDFNRDFNRILHCTAYRRLKHKTQVFFATRNDHVCTRIEHVNHVAAVSNTITKYLGLNIELASAIAIGHDLGHAPFGHEGEKIINTIALEKLKKTFWHEKNSLWFVDNLETLPDPSGYERNLSLTYAVRDGIISHCGEVDDKAIYPRDNLIVLEEIKEPNQYAPYTWEGCVVKIADKISYLGRDIEDALTLKILTISQIKELKRLIKAITKEDFKIREINNTALMHDFIISLCNNSSPENGLRLSGELYELMKTVKDFNYKYIYYHNRLQCFKEYSKLIINSIFNSLFELYSYDETLSEIEKISPLYPLLISTFSDWLIKYSKIDLDKRKKNKWENEVIYDINNKDDYIRVILDYISGMTDSFAIRVFNELTSF